jgi:GNAT superfamily N-acetyltransferase
MAFKRIDRLSEDHVRDLHALYQREWWSEGRTLPDIRRMLDHSDALAAFVDGETGRLAAFARVLTDYTYKALIFDVMVDERHRGAGLGRMVMDAVLSHPDLQAVEHFELYCRPEMVPFYERWGFTAELGELQLMRRAS